MRCFQLENFKLELNTPAPWEEEEGLEEQTFS